VPAKLSNFKWNGIPVFRVYSCRIMPYFGVQIIASHWRYSTRWSEPRTVSWGKPLSFRIIRRRHYEPQSSNCHTFHIRVWRGFQTCRIHEVPKWWRHRADSNGESCFNWKGYNLTGTHQFVATAQKYGCEDIIRQIARKTLKLTYSYPCVFQMAVSKRCKIFPHVFIF